MQRTPVVFIIQDLQIWAEGHQGAFHLELKEIQAL
jgi:hypothetical protein